jgi:hypothetical protein
MNIMTPYANFDLSAIESCSEIPACRGPEVLALLVEVDPINNPDAGEKRYPERVDKFSRNFFWRMLTGDITIRFLDAAVERMFNAQEVTDEVEPAKLRELQHRIVNLFWRTTD